MSRDDASVYSTGQPGDSIRLTWDESYRRKENFVFEPGDEVVRFVSRYMRRRTGIREFIDLHPGAAGARVLDLGCGIGRNLIFGQRMGLEMYGIDLSSEAAAQAREWLAAEGFPGASSRVLAGSVSELPWSDGYFHHVLSDSVLDSMAFNIARNGVREVARVLRSGGLLYASVISGDESGHEPGFAGELVVQTDHERGTIQSYFDRKKIAALLGSEFECLSCNLVRHQNADGSIYHGRWHVAARRR